MESMWTTCLLSRLVVIGSNHWSFEQMGCYGREVFLSRQVVTGNL